MRERERPGGDTLGRGSAVNDDAGVARIR
jgi:hypothetical protein